MQTCLYSPQAVCFSGYSDVSIKSVPLPDGRVVCLPPAMSVIWHGLWLPLENQRYESGISF